MGYGAITVKQYFLDKIKGRSSKTPALLKFLAFLYFLRGGMWTQEAWQILDTHPDVTAQAGPSDWMALGRNPSNTFIFNRNATGLKKVSVSGCTNEYLG